uniref:Uncharacterized protein n=1 Tax=Panagrolaimus sp. ES5 TaxID=591445 RepID=A0AC34F2E5_9BILA
MLIFPTFRIPVSPSIAIELTSQSVTACFNDEISTRSFEKALDFKNSKSSKFLGKELQELQIPDRVRERKDTFWTIGIPDNANQKSRQDIKKAFEEFRQLSLKSPENQNLADTKDDKTENEGDTLNLPPPPIRLINHSTAAAISYLQSLRDQERAENESEGDIYPYLPHRHFLTIFVSGYQVYGAEFETIDGLVQQKRSYEFKDEDFKTIIKQVKKEGEENLIPALNSLWMVILADLKNGESSTGKVDEKYASIPTVLFTYNKKSYLIEKSGVEEIPPKYYITPPDKFSLFPSINNIRQDWGHGFILKGINVKARMLAGDADMIDYDVPSGYVGYATIECKDKFRATLIRDGEKLPIHRTIFEAEKPIPFSVKIGVQSVTTHEAIRQNFVCIVDENGIFLSDFK